MTEQEYAIHGAKLMRKELLEKLNEVNEFLSSGKKRFLKEVKVKKQGGARKPFTRTELERLKHYRSKGWSYEKIAEKLGRNVSTLYAALRNENSKKIGA